MDIFNVESNQTTPDGSSVAGMWSKWNEGTGNRMLMCMQILTASLDMFVVVSEENLILNVRTRLQFLYSHTLGA